MMMKHRALLGSCEHMEDAYKNSCCHEGLGQIYYCIELQGSLVPLVTPAMDETYSINQLTSKLVEQVHLPVVTENANTSENPLYLNAVDALRRLSNVS